MLARTIQLQNADASLCRWICQGEADRMMERGEIFRVSKRKAAKKIYRFHPVAEPSNSHESSASLTNSDMRAVAGLMRVDEIWIERLIGFSLLAEGTQVPASGYLA